MAGLSDVHFVVHTSAAAEKPTSKACLWEKALPTNLQLSTSESIHILASDGAPAHINWVYTEAATEGIYALLTTL